MLNSEEPKRRCPSSMSARMVHAASDWAASMEKFQGVQQNRKREFQVMQQINLGGPSRLPGPKISDSRFDVG